MVRKIIVGTLLSLSAFSTQAQQDGQYTQYMYNTQVFNPGYTGTIQNTTVSALHRQQWLGVDGAPQTSTFAINAPLKKGMGIGGTIIHDALGVTTETFAAIDIAYRLKINRKYTFSMGLKGGANFMTADLSQLNVYQPGEQNSLGQISRLSPAVGAGFFFYSDQFYVGLSAPNLVPTADNAQMSSLSQRERIHTNLIAGYVFNVSNKIQLKPAGLIKYVDGAPLNWHLSMNAQFNDQFTAGLAYQANSSASVLLGMNVKKRVFIGYSYDVNVAALRKVGTGSHEVFLRYTFGHVNNLLQSPRFF